MKATNPKTYRGLLFMVLVLILTAPAFSQTCPSPVLTTLSTYPNTYYPAAQPSSPASGSSSIVLGPAGYGSHAIVQGDVLLIMQMQGAGFDATNVANYGDGSSGTASGYYNDANLLAGNYEWVVANNSVPVSGGTLSLIWPLQHSYLSQAYNGTKGQYTYQIIYVPLYYNLRLGATIHVPAWNGSSGGVLVMEATDTVDFNGYTISAAGAGFRGGASRQLRGGSGDNNGDVVTLSTINNNGGKGEGIAGTPRYINNSAVLLDNSVEGYPNGAEARGAPGNAGGGGTDYDPSQNDQNDGGGGGGNGGAGGTGGNSWSTNEPMGGFGGAKFAQASPSRLVMGGGGGGGTNNDGTPSNSGIYSSGVAGGGIVIIYAGVFKGTSVSTINVNGASGYTNVQNDGSGGGGAGGSVLLFASRAGSSLSNVSVTANGGAGGSNTGGSGGSFAKHGPGGGGAGGVIYSNGAIGSTSSTGGAAGTTYTGSNYGATSGNSGVVNQNIAASSVEPFPVICFTLPVTFLSFTAQPAKDNVTLDWVVESQTATGYVVERSYDGNNFDAIGTVSAQTGSDAASNSYTYNDNNASSSTGTLYYRIQEEDATGQSFYSTVVIVKISSAAANTGVYPNPARASFTLTFNASTAGAMSLRLFDLEGRQVLSQPFQASTGTNAVTVNGLGTLPEGMYILQWFDGLKPYTSKVMIRH
jgi:hypothetical protein